MEAKGRQPQPFPLPRVTAARRRRPRPSTTTMPDRRKSQSYGPCHRKTLRYGIVTISAVHRRRLRDIAICDSLSICLLTEAAEGQWLGGVQKSFLGRLFALPNPSLRMAKSEKQSHLHSAAFLCVPLHSWCRARLQA